MTVYEHATKIWAVLALAAKNRQILTYDIVGRLIGIPRRGLGQHLAPIQSYCLVKGFHALTSIVVSEVTGIPSIGFTAAEAGMIQAEQMRVHGYDWLSLQAPTPEELQQAAIERPSCGPQE